jgi:cation diffusion facilitator CzcD-associated flavoprotein CzcO
MKTGAPPSKGEMAMTIHFNSVVVGGGQAGLSVTYYLTQQAVDHVVLEQADRSELEINGANS